MYGRGAPSGGFGFGPGVTPPIIKQLMIANAAVFVAQWLGLLPGSLGGGLSGRLFAADPVGFFHGFLWQPFTYMWLHGSIGHIAANMFALWMFGSQLALVWGAQRFLRFYLLCGVGAGFLIVTVPWLPVLLGSVPAQEISLPTLGASGAVMGVLLAYSLTWPDRQIMFLFPPVAFRAIWLIPILFVLEYTMGPRNVSHLGHLGGVLIGWLLLRSSGDTARLLSIEQIRYRWRRWRMRRRLRTVRNDEWRARGRDDDERPGPWLH